MTNITRECLNNFIACAVIFLVCFDNPYNVQIDLDGDSTYFHTHARLFFFLVYTVPSSCVCLDDIHYRQMVLTPKVFALRLKWKVGLIHSTVCVLLKPSSFRQSEEASLGVVVVLCESL